MLTNQKRAVMRKKLMMILGNAGVLGAVMALVVPLAMIIRLCDAECPFNLTREEVNFFLAISAATYPLSVSLASYFMSRIGCKGTLLTMNMLGVLGWFLLATASLQSSRDTVYAQMFIARFVFGIMIGLSDSAMFIYGTEISTSQMYNDLGWSTSTSIASSLLFMCTCVLTCFIKNVWPLIAIVLVLYQIIATVCVLAMVETPSWLIYKRYEERARKSLWYFRGVLKNDTTFYKELEKEFAQIKNTVNSCRNRAISNSVPMWSSLGNSFSQLSLALFFFVYYKLSYSFLMTTFALQIENISGASIDLVPYAVPIAVGRCIIVLLLSNIIEKCSHRKLTIISKYSVILVMLLMFVKWSAYLKSTEPLMAIVLIVLNFSISTVTLATVAWYVTSEATSWNGDSFAVVLMVFFALLPCYEYIMKKITAAPSCAF